MSTTMDEVRAVSDIVQVIKSYGVRLVKSGANWKAKCPFHVEDTPSFVVSQSKQICKCFGECGMIGDVFDFVARKEGVGFRSAMEILCHRAGIEFISSGWAEENRTKRQSLFDFLLKINDEYFQPQLFKNSKAMDYLTCRGVSKESICNFSIGYDPGEAHKYCSSIGMVEIGEEVGILNEWRSVFGGRIVFPIYDGLSRIVGFGGRAIDNFSQVKYLNSSQSLVFDKSKALFGYRQSMPLLAKGEAPVVMEGYLDVIAAHSIGVKTAVATMGTSLTSQQATLLANNSDKIVLCYDGDSAGVDATKRCAEAWKDVVGATADIRVASLPIGKDPDDYIRDGNVELFKSQIEKLSTGVNDSSSYEKFMVQYVLSKYNLSNEDDRQSALTEALSVISRFTPHHVRDKALMMVVHLHPFYRLNPTKAINSMLSDLVNLKGVKSKK